MKILQFINRKMLPIMDALKNKRKNFLSFLYLVTRRKHGLKSHLWGIDEFLKGFPFALYSTSKFLVCSIVEMYLFQY